MSVAAYFDGRAKEYEEKAQREGKSGDGMHSKAAAAVVAALQLPRADMKRALEFGAGTGLVTLHVAPHLEELFAVDVSQGMLDELARKMQGETDGRGKIRLHCADICRVPFSGADNLDAAFTVLTLHHVDDVASAVAAMAAPLRTGGRVALVDFEAGPDSHRFHAKSAHHAVKRHGLTRAELHDAMNAAGLHESRVDEAFKTVKTLHDGESLEVTVLVGTATK